MSDTVSPQTLMATSHTIDVSLIDPNPEQPRKYFDEAELAEMAESIKANGVIQPIVVEITEDGERYILHDGERRLRASKLAGLAEIPAYILEPGTDKKALLIRAVVANLQRSNLTAMELAKAYQEMKDMGMSDEEIGQQVGKSRSVVANTRRLLNLPEPVQQKVGNGKDKLSERQALALLPFYQLPKPVQEKLVGGSGGWGAKEVIEKPEEHDSDQIRQKISNALIFVSQSFRLFAHDEVVPFSGGVRHSKCTDCPFLVKMGKEPRCTDIECYKIKVHNWKRNQLEDAQKQTGLKPFNPAISNFPKNKYTTFYHSELPVIELALANKCPNLHLTCEDYESSRLRPEGVIKQICYACVHLNSNKCKCQQGTEKVVNEKANKAKIRSIKDSTINLVANALSPLSMPALKALALYHSSWNEKEKVNAADSDALARKVAVKLVEQAAYVSHDNNPTDYQLKIDNWLNQIGLSNEPDFIADVSRRLAKITGWISILTKELPAVEAIRGNITNLSKLGDEIFCRDEWGDDEEKLSELAALYDQTKMTLLNLLPIVEAHREEIDIAMVSWLAEAEIGSTTWLQVNANDPTLNYTLVLIDDIDRIRAINKIKNKPPVPDLKPMKDDLKKIQKWLEKEARSSTRTVIINKGMAMDDLEHDITRLIEKYGELEILLTLRAEIYQTAETVEAIRLTHVSAQTQNRGA